MKIERIHHVAYRCKDVRKTVEFYTRMLKMEFVMALPRVRSHDNSQPAEHSMSVMLDAGNGAFLTFVETPQAPDSAEPLQGQHIAFRVASRAALLMFKAHLEAQGVALLEGGDHPHNQTICLRDPDGNCVELICSDPVADTQTRQPDSARWALLDEWDKRRAAPAPLPPSRVGVGA